MSEKVIFPVFGSQSISAVLGHINENVFDKMTFDVRYALATELMKRFKEVRFKVMFDPTTGKIESVKELLDE